MGDLARIGLIMGDPSGIGPEVVVRAATRMTQEGKSAPILIGSAEVFARDMKMCGFETSLKPLTQLIEPATVYLVESVDRSTGPFPYGSPSAESGRAAYESIVRGVELAMAGELDAIVTGPISKLAIHQAGVDFPGHTELLAHLTGAVRHAMMLTTEKLRVTLVTTHLPIEEIAKKITGAAVLDKIELSAIFLSQCLNIRDPLIGVCALNPHAGEGGVFGKEEKELAEAVREARLRGVRTEGPLPADTLFARWEKYDCIVANYHDQGLIPIKMLSFGEAVNVTLGLPINRTSPDHGTALDIAGKGEADPGSMMAAVRFARKMSDSGRIGWESRTLN